MRVSKRYFQIGNEMNPLQKIAFLVLMLLMVKAAAYEPITHSNLSQAATVRSVLADGNTFGKFGLDIKPVDLQTRKFPNSNAVDQTIIDLVRFGANWEDSRGTLQATRHFYNPVDGSKLLPLLGETSPDWALEDRGLKDGQAYSYRLMRRNFFKALTEPAMADRDAAWGLTFQTMGHVIHHLQDMAQPQHVRGDAHCDAVPCVIPGGLFGFYSPSIYEIKTWPNANKGSPMPRGRHA